MHGVAGTVFSKSNVASRHQPGNLEYASRHLLGLQEQTQPWWLVQREVPWPSRMAWEATNARP